MKRAWLLALLVACSDAKLADGQRELALDAGSDGGVDATLVEAGTVDVAVPATDSSTDAPRDVGADAPRDAGADVAICKDAVPDAGIPDAGDGGFPYSGTWIPIQGLPADCSQRVAVDPAASIPPIKWRPCTCGRQGCAAFRADWGDPRPGGSGFRMKLEDDDPVLLAGKPYFLFFRGHAAFGGAFYSAYVATLESMDGEVKFAIGTKYPTTPSCNLGIGFGSGGIAVHFRYGNAPTPQRDGALAWASWASPTAFQVMPMSEATLGGAALHLENNAGHLYMEVHNNGQRMRVFDTATSTLHPDTGLGAVAPHEVPDGAIVAGGAYPWALYLMKPDASFTRLVDPAGPGRVVQEFRVDRAANAIVWLDADDTTPATSDYYLWTSPYAPTPSGIQRRRVAKIPDTAMDGGARFAVHNGLVLFKVTKDMGLLVRLSDGKGWSIPSEAGHALVKPVWVDDEYVYFNTASDRGTDGLLRIARSTLGAPTVPSGLPDAGP